jgi:hypothetical protein
VTWQPHAEMEALTATVCTENLNPDIVVMKASKNRA